MLQLGQPPLAARQRGSTATDGSLNWPIFAKVSVG